MSCLNFGQFETWYKVNIGRDKREEISCIPPDEYKDRLVTLVTFHY